MKLRQKLAHIIHPFDPPVACLRNVVEHFIDDERKDYESVPPNKRDMHHIYLDLFVIRDWLEDECRWKELPPPWRDKK